MSHSKEIIQALMTEDLYTAKKLINEDLVAKMGKALEAKLIDFGPTVFNEGSKPDFLDLDKDGNKKEPMKNAAKEAKSGKKVRNESANLESISEDFENELRSLVEEIEEETGEELTEEEIMELAQELLDVISEESEEDSEDEDEDEDEKVSAKKQGSAGNVRLGTNAEY